MSTCALPRKQTERLLGLATQKAVAGAVWQGTSRERSETAGHLAGQGGRVDCAAVSTDPLRLRLCGAAAAALCLRLTFLLDDVQGAVHDKVQLLLALRIHAAQHLDVQRVVLPMQQRRAFAGMLSEAAYSAEAVPTQVLCPVHC